MRPRARLAAWDRPTFRMVAVAIGLIVGLASTASVPSAEEESGAKGGMSRSMLK